MKKNKHDQAILELEERVRDKYQITLRNVLYYLPHRKDVAGELDLVGICNGNWDIYEVKTNDGYDTAVKQLDRAQRLLGNCGKIRTFYYSAKKKKIQPVNTYNRRRH